MGHGFLLEALAVVADQSLFLMFLALLVIHLAVVEAGYRLGRRAFRCSGRRSSRLARWGSISAARGSVR
jgi:hypothetical protein